MTNKIEKIGNFNGYSVANEIDGSFPLRGLFLNNHKTLPSEWGTKPIKKEAVEKYVLENKESIILTHYQKNGKDIQKCILYLEDEGIYVFFRTSWEEDDEDEDEGLYNGEIQVGNKKYIVNLLFTKKTKKVDSIIDYFIESVVEKKQGCLNILIKEEYGYELKQQDITCPDIDFDLNYNPDFKPIHELIVQRLSVNKSKGLVLLHGKAGTGKTNYIRYLIHQLKKRVIYIPPNMTNVISDPELIKFFMTYSNSILVIEDAENVLMKRSANSTQAISNILNLTDGLLSDCTNIQVVATFNMDILKIDEALMRKGRLIAKYEFKELEPEITEKLGKKIGVNIKGKHTLADIYNSKEDSFSIDKEKIGF